MWVLPGIIAHVMLTTALTMTLSTLQTRTWAPGAGPSPEPTELASSRAKLFPRHHTHPIFWMGKWGSCPKPRLVDSGPMGKRPGPASPSGTGASPHWSRAVLSAPSPLPPAIPRTHCATSGK